MASDSFLSEAIHYQALVAHFLEKQCVGCVVSDERGYV
jgi:hypothetical protein